MPSHAESKAESWPYQYFLGARACLSSISYVMKCFEQKVVEQSGQPLGTCHLVSVVGLSERLHLNIASFYSQCLQ